MSESEEGYNSDEALQELYAAGKIKPGLNIPVQKTAFINDPSALQEKLKAFECALPWIERLDIVNEFAPIAPELSVEMVEKEQFVQSGKTDDIALNEFKRETMFHRQAQAAVLEGIPRLKSVGIPTERPEDYFAEMMKSDEHMQKVRQSLLQKQAGLERSEKVKKIRAERKLAKQKQVESTLKKQKEKRQLNEDIKKYRKGINKNLDFLESDKKPQKHSKVGKKREMKNQKYGYGGKKKGTKNNQFVKKTQKKPRLGKSKRKAGKK